MTKQVKDSKSARLKQLEDVFERRTRRFSPFEILGLKSNDNSEHEKNHASTSISNYAIEQEQSIVDGPPMEGSDPPTPGSLGPTPGVGSPGPGGGRPSIVVEEYKNNSTTEGPPMEGSDPPISGSLGPTPGSPVSSAAINLTKPVARSQSVADILERTSISPLRKISAVADVVAATQAGTQIGPKARKVLAYLNTIRSLEYEAYTVPVGYGQISTQVGVDSDYLRRKALPKLAMLGFIAIARKSLDGTVYHLPHDREYIATVTGEMLPKIVQLASPTLPVAEALSIFSLPEWIDKEQWGWLSEETIQRLVQKAGSEVQAREKLEIIIYNETHGTPHQRVRNRRSVLAHYLSTSQAEIWPNDDGFETITMKQSRLEKEQAQKEKALAEEVLKARKEAHKARFCAALSESQIQWMQQEAKRIVDMRPEAKLLTSRFPLYKAEEDRLLEEWMERAGYGETVPSI